MFLKCRIHICIITITETKRFTKWERSDYAKKECRTDELYY